MVSASKSEQQSELETKQFPGVFGSGSDSRRLAGKLENLLGTRTPNIFRSPLEDILLGGGAGTGDRLTEATRGIAGGREGATIATGELERVLAPTLVKQEGQDISNLQRAFGGSQQAGIGERGLNTQAFLKLMELALPQIVAGQISKSKSGPPPTGLGGTKDVKKIEDLFGLKGGGLSRHVNF